MTARYSLHFLVAVAISQACVASVRSEPPELAPANRPQRQNRCAPTSTATRCRRAPLPAWARCAFGMRAMSLALLSLRMER